MERKKQLRRGDVKQVAAMTVARGHNSGKGYAWRYVYEVLNEHRSNKDIEQCHDELIALRTPQSKGLSRARKHQLNRSQAH